MSTQVAKYGTVGLLSGGLSSERDISLMTGAAVLKSMRNLGIDVIAIDVQKDFIDSLRNYQLDRVFVALHGPGGEDGTLQGALEYLGIPYTGSGVMASALAMDKLRCKQLWKGIGLPTADFYLLDKDSNYQEILNKLGGKCVVKPSCEGSSIGMSLAESTQQLREAWVLASEFDTAVIAESKLEGEEYTVAILGDAALHR